MRIFYTLLAAILLAFTGCSDGKKSSKEITVAATPVPHVEILEVVKPLLEKEGYTLKIQPFSDYVIPNIATENGEVLANFFQHEPYLEEFNKNKNTHLVKTVAVHIEPMGVYSRKIKSLDELKEGAIVAIPNDPTNGGRALDVLQSAGLIKLDKKNAITTLLDITENPKNLKIETLEAAQLPRTLDDFEIAVINTNYALAANLNPLKDALAIEAKDSPYANIVVVKAGNENLDAIKALNKAITSQEVKDFIQEKYQGAILEVF
ncbi:MAG: MetQ/NlpA family ABC transporter substrate-binding protein [Campylobacteraceae bacterium]|nr:MetQ/NlpA family ABC transporter substrate-binding protein [Campylobacteraceae bacterium]